MGFFDELQEKLVKSGKAVAEKGKEVADVTKLKVQISAEERKLDDLYAKVGKAFFEANPDSEAYEEEFAQIRACLQTIADCKQELNDKKGVAVCSECGAENPAGASFCNVCGAKYEKAEESEVEEAEEVEEVEEQEADSDSEE